ncbi:hypothetical protein ERHA55_13310 [Erwinia rhapontici]|nr:hypothetical protein ERHA55_13310 [Erwinia rhapontici]
MNIRLAESKDAFALSALLTELGYADTAPFIERRLAQLMIDETEQLLIAEQGNTVLGFLSLHFIPQLALAGDFARISYFCIAEGERSKGAGSSCYNMLSSWQWSVAVTGSRYTAMSVVKRRMRFTRARVTRNHHATTSKI